MSDLIEKEILREKKFCNLEEAPSKCLNEHCEYAEVFKDKLMCMFYRKWFDLTPVEKEETDYHAMYKPLKDTIEQICKYADEYKVDIDIRIDSDGEVSVSVCPTYRDKDKSNTQQELR